MDTVLAVSKVALVLTGGAFFLASVAFLILTTPVVHDPDDTQEW